LKSNPEIEKRIREIMSKFEGIGNESFAELAKRKAFSKVLRRLELINVHYYPFASVASSSEFALRLKVKYDKEVENLKNESEEVQKHAKALLGFFEKLYSDPLLNPFFERWFKEACLNPRQRFSDVLMTYLSSGNFDVFGLQEVSKTMHQTLQILRPRILDLGFDLVLPANSSSKTVGALLVRRGVRTVDSSCGRNYYYYYNGSCALQ
jgi:hypothetical protein